MMSFLQLAVVRALEFHADRDDIVYGQRPFQACSIEYADVLSYQIS